MSKELILKTHPEPFAAIESGEKTFEYRKNDRNFQVGDTLVLQEFYPAKDGGINIPGLGRVKIDGDGKLSGKEIRAKITYILENTYGVPDGYCVMGIIKEPASIPSALREIAVWLQSMATEPEMSWAERLEVLADDIEGA